MLNFIANEILTHGVLFKAKFFFTFFIKCYNHYAALDNIPCSRLVVEPNCPHIITSFFKFFFGPFF